MTDKHRLQEGESLDTLLRELLKENISAETRSKAALALQYLSLNSENALAILKHPDTLIALKKVLISGSLEEQQYAAGAIAHLAVNEDAERLIARADGIISSLVNVLLVGTGSAKQQAITALENLTFHSESAAIICKTEGLLDMLFALMSNKNWDIGIERAVAVLHNLAVVPECKEELAAFPKLIPALMNVLFFGSMRAKEDTAAIIGNLAVNIDVHTLTTQNQGLLEGLVELISCGNERAKSDAAVAIGNLGVHASLRTVFVQNPVLLEALDSMLNSLSERQAGEAACCLQNLSVCSMEDKIRIAQSGHIVEGLIKLMIVTPFEPQHQEDSTSTILNLLIGCPENKRAFIGMHMLLHGILFCMRSGTDRSQENGAAIIQNLACHHAENRIAISEVPDILETLAELILVGSSRAQVHALAAIVSIAKSEEGAVAVLRVRGMLESLIIMSQSPKFDSRQNAVRALQTLAQHLKTATILVGNMVPSRTFLPLLVGESCNEQDEKLKILAAIGLMSLCVIDTKICELIPLHAIALIMRVIARSVQKIEPTTVRYRIRDLLRCLRFSALSEQTNKWLITTGIAPLLAQILSKGDTKDSVEALKLCWQLAFLKEGKEVLMAAKIESVLRQLQEQDSDASFWALGVLLQMGCISTDRFRLNSNILNRPPLADDIVIIHHPLNHQEVEIIQQQLQTCGFSSKVSLLNGDQKHSYPMDLVNFLSVLDLNPLVVIAMSNHSEISPYCRFKVEQSRSRGCLIVPIIVEPGYVQHGYFQDWAAVLVCSNLAKNPEFDRLLMNFIRALQNAHGYILQVNTHSSRNETNSITGEMVVELRLAIDSTHEPPSSFYEDIQQDMADATNSARSRFRIISVSTGQTMIKVAISDNGLPTSQDIVEYLQKQAVDPTSCLRNGKQTSRLLNLSVIRTISIPNTYPLQTSHIVNNLSTTDEGTSAKDQNYLSTTDEGISAKVNVHLPTDGEANSSVRNVTEPDPKSLDDSKISAGNITRLGQEYIIMNAAKDEDPYTDVSISSVTAESEIAMHSKIEPPPKILHLSKSMAAQHFSKNPVCEAESDFDKSSTRNNTLMSPPEQLFASSASVSSASARSVSPVVMMKQDHDVLELSPSKNYPQSSKEPCLQEYAELYALIKKQDIIIQEQQAKLEMLQLEIQVYREGGQKNINDHHSKSMSPGQQTTPGPLVWQVSPVSMESVGTSIIQADSVELASPTQDFTNIQHANYDSAALDDAAGKRKQMVNSVASGSHSSHSSTNQREQESLMTALEKITDELMSRFESKMEETLKISSEIPATQPTIAKACVPVHASQLWPTPASMLAGNRGIASTRNHAMHSQSKAHSALEDGPYGLYSTSRNSARNMRDKVSLTNPLSMPVNTEAPTFSKGSLPSSPAQVDTSIAPSRRHESPSPPKSQWLLNFSEPLADHRESFHSRPNMSTSGQQPLQSSFTSHYAKKSSFPGRPSGVGLSQDANMLRRDIRSQSPVMSPHILVSRTVCLQDSAPMSSCIVPPNFVHDSNGMNKVKFK